LLDMGYSPSLPSMSSIGYREMADYVTGVTSIDTAIERIRRETRRLVRRQRAWFRATDERIMWLDAAERQTVEQAVTLLEGMLR